LDRFFYCNLCFSDICSFYQRIFDDKKYADYKLDLLKSSKERVKYTIYFSLTKTNDEWVLDDLTDTEEDKILGIYEY